MAFVTGCFLLLQEWPGERQCVIAKSLAALQNTMDWLALLLLLMKLAMGKFYTITYFKHNLIMAWL